MKVAQIWRYPVKSMAGEPLNHARIGPLGIEGDRVVHVENAQGLVITARTHHRLLGHHVTLDESGEPLVGGLMWGDPKVRTDVEDIVGPGARLIRDDSSDRIDVLPLLVATDGAIASFGRDGRRLRPNLVIGGVEGLAERSWPGQCLHRTNVGVPLQGSPLWWGIARKVAASCDVQGVDAQSRPFSASLISINNFSSFVGPGVGAGGGSFLNRLTCLISMKITNAMMMKSNTLCRNTP